jgi:hypothetical protein
MMTEKEYLALVRQVVETSLPDEIDVLDFREDEIGEMYRRKGQFVKKATGGQSAEFEFIPGLKEGIEVFKLAKAIYDFLTPFWKPKPAVSDSLTTSQSAEGFRITLVLNKVPPELAAKIAKECADFLVQAASKR